MNGRWRRAAARGVVRAVGWVVLGLGLTATAMGQIGPADQSGGPVVEQHGPGAISGPAGGPGTVQTPPDADFVLHVPIDVRNLHSSWRSVKVKCLIGRGLIPPPPYEGVRPWPPRFGDWLDIQSSSPLFLAGGAFQGTVDLTFKLGSATNPDEAVDSYACWWVFGGWDAWPCARGDEGCTEERAMNPDGFVPYVYGEIPR